MSPIPEAITALRRRWLWLIVPPALAGLVGYVAAIARPTTYTSVATLLLDDAGARKAEALMRSTAASDAVRQQVPDAEVRMRWATTSGEPRRAASVFNLMVQGHTPHQAQNVATALIDAWLMLTKPRADELARIDADRARFSEEVDLLEGLMKKAAKAAPATIPSYLPRRDTLKRELVRLDREAAGTSRDVIVAQPSLPIAPDPKHALVIAVAAGCAMLLLSIGGIVGWHLLTQWWHEP